MDVHFFLKFFFKTKTFNITVVGNVQRNVFLNIFQRLTCLAVFGRFPRQKWNFRVNNFGKNQQKKITVTIFKSHYKSQFIYLTQFPEHLSLYEISSKSNYGLVFFGRFLNFGPFFGALIFWFLKCVFTKCTFSGPQLNRLGLVWYLLNTLKALALHGCPVSACASHRLDNIVHNIREYKYGNLFNSTPGLPS